jgi:hypothetical protein
MYPELYSPLFSFSTVEPITRYGQRRARRHRQACTARSSATRVRGSATWLAANWIIRRFAIQTKKGQERQQSVDVRIEQLKNAFVESARLLHELAQQVQALSLAEQELQKRMQLALIVGWIGIALGVGASILALVK